MISTQGFGKMRLCHTLR